MKRTFILAVVMLLALTTAAHAVSLLGPAEPAASPGKFSIGMGYFFYDDKWKNNGSFRFQRNQLFAEGSYGFYKGMEVFLRLGGADAELPNFSPDFSFKDNMKPYSGIGARGVLYKFNPQFDIGGTLYIDRVWSDYNESLTPTGSVKLKTPWSAGFAPFGPVDSLQGFRLLRRSQGLLRLVERGRSHPGERGSRRYFTFDKERQPRGRGFRNEVLLNGDRATQARPGTAIHRQAVGGRHGEFRVLDRIYLWLRPAL